MRVHESPTTHACCVDARADVVRSRLLGIWIFGTSFLEVTCWNVTQSRTFDLCTWGISINPNHVTSKMSPSPPNEHKRKNKH